MKKILLIFGAIGVIGVLLVGCTRPDESLVILKREGYQNIEIKGYPLFGGCSEDDTFRTEFAATKNGQYVKGVVCSGYFKGATVRTYNQASVWCEVQVFEVYRSYMSKKFVYFASWKIYILSLKVDLKAERFKREQLTIELQKYQEFEQR